MRKPLAALLLTVGLAAAIHGSALARSEETDAGDLPARLVNAQMIREARSALARTGVAASSNTTYVGFVPGKVTATNYWGIGVGNFHPYSSDPADYGYWSWDNDGVHDNIAEVHGDSLFGWWPYRNLYIGTGGLTLADDQRPWWALDMGNNANYVINQGAAHKRTFGVVGVWHLDTGNTGPGAGQGVQWTPLGGSYSLWCGLRRDSDISGDVDPITKNPWNARCLYNSGIAGGVASIGGIGTNQQFPGYGSQWDQIAYRDINVSGASTVTLRFRYRTNMSTGYGTTASTRTGWFNKDPLDHHWWSSAPNNFISSTVAQASAPIDSFMVYIGGPVGYAAGSDFVGSDGLTHQVYDAQRRWFSEVLRVNEPSVPYYELRTTYGNDTTFRATKFISGTVPVSGTWGGRTRIVFRTKTNRGFDDESGGNSSDAYRSGGLGAVVIDDVDYSADGGATWVPFGDFEVPGAGGSVDNDTAVDPLNAWKTTGKPPAIFHHVHTVDDLIYEDLCGPVGSPLRICNLSGNVISAGDHDRSEAAGGTFDTAEQERYDGIYSPTINLRNGGGTNEMGINASIATVSEDYYLEYDVYTGIFDFITQGNAWRWAFSAYPGRQVDGTKCWSDWRFPAGIIFNPKKECFQDQEPALRFGILKWNSASAEGGTLYPDSIRCYLGKFQQCFRFAITTGCSPTDGAYWDNLSLAFIDGGSPPIGIDIWQLINDTFTVNGGINRSNVLPGSSAFDTTTALVKIGLNISQTTNSTSRYTVPGDTTTVSAEGNSLRLDLVFRINPGPGNYATVGDRNSNLRLAPSSSTPVNVGSPQTASPNFWEQYLLDNGVKGTPGGHPAGPVNGGKRWSNLVWNSARMDTTEINIFAISGRSIGGPVQGFWSTMYNEVDPKFTVLGIVKNRCFLKTATSPVTFANTTCDISQTDGWPSASGYTAENGLPLGKTYEYSKILPDGQFTPGTHVEYFFRREDTAGSGGPCEGLAACLAPDTNLVYPQASESSTDGHRWQEFSVLPDAWKKGAYGGLGQACMLYVDLNDRRGNERVWVSIADSIGATVQAKYGAHNGWHAAGTADVNDPAGFVRNKNEQPGSTWDMFGVKASESLNSKAGTIGAWNSNHTASNVDQKWSYLGPTIGMLEAYYKCMLILTGDLNSAILGPSNDFGANDCKMIQDFLAGGTSGDPRFVMVEGDGFVESSATPAMNGLLTDWFKVGLRDPSYLLLTKNVDPCVDLVNSAPISATDIYGVSNGCLFTDDVLVVQPGGAEASHYSPRGVATAPVVSGVYHNVTGSEFYYSLVDGWDIENLRSRFCDGSYGRLAYTYNALTHIFGSFCSLTGAGGVITDVPQGGAPEIVDFMNLRNNPLVAGQATVDFGLSKSDRVEVKVFDVSGRLVRTLADRQFAAGRHTLTWDGVDNDGRQVARGVYFTQVKYVNRRFTDAKKLTVLK